MSVIYPNTLNLPVGSFSIIPIDIREGYTFSERLVLMTNKINEIVVFLEDFEDNSKQYTDEKIAEFQLILTNSINELNKQFEEFKIDITKTVEDNYIILNNRITDVDKQIRVDFEKALTDLEDTLKQYTDVEVIKLTNLIAFTKDELIDYINNSVIDIEVLNPLTGKVEPLQNVINSIANQFKNKSISAGEYDSLNISAGDFDSLLITAFNYDYYAVDFLTT